MDDEQQAASVNQELMTQIVAAYVRRNQIATFELPAVISTVYEALSRLDAPPAEPEIERTPAVPIRRSLTPDAVICLDCGWRGQILRRHLSTAHGLSVEQYRARWKLASDHALTAPAYSERRSMMAKEVGLGRSRAASTEPVIISETEIPSRPKRPAKPRTKPSPPETPSEA
jgi:predicted transcriptional regulator